MAARIAGGQLDSDDDGRISRTEFAAFEGAEIGGQTGSASESEYDYDAGTESESEYDSSEYDSSEYDSSEYDSEEQRY